MPIFFFFLNQLWDWSWVGLHMDSRREELCSNHIYQSYQGKDSFCSSCLPGWDKWKVGGERNTSVLKFWGLGTLGCKCEGEQVVNLPYVSTLCPRREGSPSKVQKKCGGTDHARAHGRQGLLPDLPSIRSSTITDNSKKEEEAAQDKALWAQQVMTLGLFFVAWAHLTCLKEMLRWMEWSILCHRSAPPSSASLHQQSLSSGNSESELCPKWHEGNSEMYFGKEALASC